MPQSKIKIPLDADKTLSNIMGNQNRNTSMMMNHNRLDAKQNVSIKEMLNHLDQSQKATKQKRRSQKATRQTPKLHTAVQNDENNNAKMKENLIMKVLKYQTSKRFGATIKNDLKISYTRDTLARKTPDQIEMILHRIRTFLNSRNLDAVFEHMASTCAIGYEKTITPFYNIDGFSNILLQNPDFWDCLERWKIEREMPNIPPHLQMLYIVASTTITAHELNKFQRPAKPVATELIIEDKDDKNKREKELQKEKTQFKVGQDL